MMIHDSKNNKKGSKPFSNPSQIVDAILVTALALFGFVFASWQLPLQFDAAQQ